MVLFAKLFGNINEEETLWNQKKLVNKNLKNTVKADHIQNEYARCTGNI